jgi:phage-related protein (TIGR01555 family)
MAKRAAVKTTDARPTQKFRTADSFQNFVARVGHGTGNQHDASHYGFHPVTRNRLQMEWVYRGSWVAGRVVDAVARDMTREGVDINTSADPTDVKQFNKGMSRLKVWKRLCENLKWSRLYGGSCAFLMIDGQDPATPLNPDRIGKGQFKGLLPLDRWLLNPSLQDLVPEFGPHFGKPRFYTTVPDSMGMPVMTIHHSRMVRVDGVELPYWQKIAENLWGQSVLERMWDRLLAYDSTTTGVAQLTYKAHLRTLKIPDLRGIIGQGNQAMNGVLAQVSMIRAMQTNEGMTLLDKEDEFDVQAYNFAGLDDVLIQFGEQLCGAVEMPAVRLFGQSPVGFNSGDSDLRSYYDSIKQNQEADLGPEIETLYRVAWLSEFGFEPPADDFDLEFEHLWQMDEEQKANVTKITEEAIGDAYERQIIDRSTAMRELKKLGREVGTFSLIEEEAITEAENDPPPTPEALGLVAPPKAEPGAAGAAGKKPGEDEPAAYKPDDAKPFKALDSWPKRVMRWLTRDRFDEVPRHEQTGKFTHGMGFSEKRFDERGEKDDEGEWAESPLEPVKSKSMREAIQAAHPDTCKAYGQDCTIEPWKLQGTQRHVNIVKVGEYRRDHGEPITVVKRAGEHGIVDGHHRAVAAHLQGRDVDARVVDMDKAFAEAGDQEKANEGLGILGGLHIATQLRLKHACPE